MHTFAQWGKAKKQKEQVCEHLHNGEKQVRTHLHNGEKQVCTHGHPPLVCGCNELIRKGRSWACKPKLTFLDISTHCQLIYFLVCVPPTPLKQSSGTIYFGCEIKANRDIFLPCLSTPLLTSDRECVCWKHLEPSLLSTNWQKSEDTKQARKP